MSRLMIIEILALVALVVLAGYGTMTHAGGEDLKREADWVRDWCLPRTGSQEFVLRDQTRVDCLLNDYAVEFDFAHKWAEAIGQALYYGAATDKQPGVVLIVPDRSDCRFVARIRTAIRAHRLPIQLWTIPLDCPL